MSEIHDGQVSDDGDEERHHILEAAEIGCEIFLPWTEVYLSETSILVLSNTSTEGLYRSWLVRNDLVLPKHLFSFFSKKFLANEYTNSMNYYYCTILSSRLLSFQCVRTMENVVSTSLLLKPRVSNGIYSI